MRLHIPERYSPRKGLYTKLTNERAAALQYHDGMPQNRLKTLREQRGLSQAELSRRVGVEQATISRYETKDRALRGHMIYRLATVLNVHPGEILAELPASGLDSKPERAAAEIARRLAPHELTQWLTLGVSLSRDRKIAGKIK